MPIDIAKRFEELLIERQSHADALQAIDDKLSQVEQLLGWNIVTPKKRGRPPKPAPVQPAPDVHGAVTLADHLEAVIKREGKPLGIAELIAGVKFSGHKSKAKDIRPIVSLALIKNKRFKRVGRGVYGLK